jgi:TAP-like protein
MRALARQLPRGVPGTVESADAADPGDRQHRGPVHALQRSVTMARQLANARLLTVQGYGHTEFLNPSACAANYIVSYLLDGHLPPNGSVCHQDSIPFPEVSGP